ncbi:hypothetical protein FKM82_005911 [Ascaphus truei]
MHCCIARLTSVKIYTYHLDQVNLWILSPKWTYFAGHFHLDICLLAYDKKTT